MRIITGTARGRKLREPAGFGIRPTSDMVKEAVFNIVQFDIEGRRVLDLFAGTGQLGIEALSRGAAEAVFVDRDQAAVKLIRENLKLTELEGRASVINGDGVEYLKRGGKFDLVFMDPPYDTGLLERSILVANEFDILKENGIIVCESKADKTMPELLPPYGKLRQYRYGRIMITTYSKSAE